MTTLTDIQSEIAALPPPTYAPKCWISFSS